MAARSTATTSSRRRGPTGRLSDVAGRRRGGRALPSSAIPSRIRRRPRVWRGPPAPACPARRRRARQASAASSRPRGAGAGNRSAWGCAVSAAWSTSVPSTASPAMPSASTWSMMTSSPVPPSASPVTNVADHSGRERGMGSASWAAARSSRARSSPGGGQHTCRTCSSISNAGSSAQYGRPHPGGARCSRCRSLGTVRIRSPSTRRASATLNPCAGSSTKTAPMCPAALPSPVADCIRSAALARSTEGATAGSPRGESDD